MKSRHDVWACKATIDEVGPTGVTTTRILHGNNFEARVLEHPKGYKEPIWVRADLPGYCTVASPTGNVFRAAEFQCLCSMNFLEEHIMNLYSPGECPKGMVYSCSDPSWF